MLRAYNFLEVLSETPVKCFKTSGRSNKWKLYLQGS